MGKYFLPKLPLFTKKHCCFESCLLVGVLFPDRIRHSVSYNYTLTNTVLSRAPQPFGRYCHQIPQSLNHPVKRHNRQTSEQLGILTGLCATGASNGTQKVRDVSSQHLPPPLLPTGQHGRVSRRPEDEADCSLPCTSGTKMRGTTPPFPCTYCRRAAELSTQKNLP